MSYPWDLRDLQAEVRHWSDYNFPTAQSYYPLLGVQEELGELSHAFLKMQQGIRGTPEEHRDAMMDAVGDIVIFLADFCGRNNMDLQQAVRSTWRKVEQRDWVKYPQNGLTQ